eukprot:jgi/Galph1/4204/GphlegSOOS_G2869.1
MSSETIQTALVAARRLEKNEKEVLQYVARALRVWVRDEEDKNNKLFVSGQLPYYLQIIRPIYHVVLSLYPKGEVVAYQLCQPASQLPAPNSVLLFLLQVMINPQTGEQPRRPSMITFTEEPLEAALKENLRGMDVETDVLQPAEGIDNFVRKLSKSLIDKQLATISDGNERPGLLCKENVTSSMIEALFTVAADMKEKAPWRLLLENEVYGIFIEDIFRFVIVLGSSNNVYGLAVSSSLQYFKNKYCQAMGLAMSYRPKMILCGYCSREQLVFTFRCTGCKKIYYCNESCQQKDWSLHKEECKKMRKEGQDSVSISRQIWKRKEMTLLFCEKTAIPFDDLDAQEHYHWPLPRGDQDCFPVPFVTVYEDSTFSLDRPSKEELLWLTRLCSILTQIETKPSKTFDEETCHIEQERLFLIPNGLTF